MITELPSRVPAGFLFTPLLGNNTSAGEESAIVHLGTNDTGKCSHVVLEKKLKLWFLGKVTERAVTHKLQDFLYDNAIMNPFHSNFHPEHGAETELVILTMISRDTWIELDSCCCCFSI